jgi:hypothetical protein
MKRFFVICVIVIVGWAAGSWAAAAWLASSSTTQTTTGAPDGPLILLPNVHCDFGSIPLGAPIIARFEIKNIGSHRLIVRPESGACCGQAPVDVIITVPPAASAEVIVKVDAGRRIGRLQKAVHYNTNDQALPRFTLSVSAHITEPGRWATTENQSR